MFGLIKFWLLFFALPGIALLPDITYMLFKRVFFPTPADGVMHEQVFNPKFKFQGFKKIDESMIKDAKENLLEDL